MGAGDGEAVVGEPQADQQAFGVAEVLHAGDDFLAEVAAFGEADGLVEEAGFVG